MDALARLAATPGILANLVADANDARLDAAPGDGWSPRTILAHLRDDEFLCMRVALERMLAEERPELQFVDGGEWEPGRRRSRDRKEQLLADFALQRQASLGILRLLSEADYERSGRVGEGREVTVRRFIEAWADHDAEHIAQLEAALGETYAEARARRAHPEE